MRCWVDPVEVHYGRLESGTGADPTADCRRACHDVRKLPAYSHDVVHIIDPFRIRMVRYHAVPGFGGPKQAVITGPEALPQDKRAVAADGRVDKELGEPLRLGLGANENGDSENDANQTEQKRALSVGGKTKRDVERRSHVLADRSTRRWRTASPECNRS